MFYLAAVVHKDIISVRSEPKTDRDGKEVEQEQGEFTKKPFIRYSSSLWFSPYTALTNELWVEPGNLVTTFVSIF